MIPEAFVIPDPEVVPPGSSERDEDRPAGGALRAPSSLEAYAVNFGGNCREVPAGVIAADLADSSLAATLAALRQAGARIAIRGAGHSFGRQGLCRDGWVLTGALRSSLQLLSEDRVRLPAASTWARVEADLNAVGRSIPVLTSELSTTVGGTLAAGGFGPGSIRFGAQAHLVTELTMVLPDGRTVTVTPEETPNLFYYSLFGGGRLGIIRDAVMRTVTHCPRTWVRLGRHPTLVSLVQWLTGGDPILPRLDSFLGQHSEGQFVAVQGVRAESGPSSPPDDRETWRLIDEGRLRALREERRTQWDPAYRHLWADFVVSAESSAAFASFIETSILSSPLYSTHEGHLLLLALRDPERLPSFPLSPISPSMRGLALGFGVYFSIPSGDEAAALAVRELLRQTLHACVRLGGRPYLAGWHELDEPLKRRIWGAGYRKFARLRRRYDPDSLFNANGLLDSSPDT